MLNVVQETVIYNYFIGGSKMDYDSFKRIRRPMIKALQVWDNKRPQNSERSEIEEGLKEWEEEKYERSNTG